MTNLKKIAAEMRESQIFNKGSLHKWADALDALDALATQEPVALLSIIDHCFGIPEVQRKLIGLTEAGEALPTGRYELYAIPQPAPTQPVVRRPRSAGRPSKQ